MRTVRNIGRSLFTAAALAMSGCSVPAAQPGSGPGAELGEIPLRVQNQHWADMTVYAEISGVRFRMGEVTSMGSATLRWPRAAHHTPTRVHLILDPLGSARTFRTGPIPWTDDEGMVFRIENHLALSSLYPR